jgi:hypothetical protein
MKLVHWLTIFTLQIRFLGYEKEPVLLQNDEEGIAYRAYALVIQLMSGVTLNKLCKEELSNNSLETYISITQISSHAGLLLLRAITMLLFYFILCRN